MGWCHSKKKQDGLLVASPTVQQQGVTGGVVGSAITVNPGSKNGPSPNEGFSAPSEPDLGPAFGKQDGLVENILRASTRSSSMKSIREKGSSEPDLEWLNWTLQQIWPFANEAIEKIMHRTVEPLLQNALPMPLNSIVFSKFDLGDTFPIIEHVHACKKQHEEDPGVELDLHIRWDCKADIELCVKSMATLGIHQLTLTCDLTVVLKPLMQDLPIVGGLQLFLLSAPQLDWNFTGVTSFLDAPLIRQTLRNVVCNFLIENYCLPNRIWIPFAWPHQIDYSAQQFPQPDAVMRVTVVEARNLIGMDWHLFSKNTSDPYAIVRIGARHHKTQVIKRDLNPKWGSGGCADFFVFNVHQQVTIELYDHDLGTGDDFLGQVRGVEIHHLLRNPDQWFELYPMSPSADSQSSPNLGSVRVHCEVLGLTEKPIVPIFRVPIKRGAGSNTALISVKIKAIRGLEKKHSTGAVIHLKCKGGNPNVALLSRPSWYEEPYPAAWGGIDLDVRLQQLIEYLAVVEKLDKSKIAAAASVEESLVEDILLTKPSFITRWNHGFQILVENPVQSKLKIALWLANGKKAHAWLPQPLEVASVMAMQPENMRLATIVKLQVDHSHFGSHKEPPLIDLDMEVKVRLLTTTDKEGEPIGVTVAEVSERPSFSQGSTLHSQDFV